MTEQDKQYTTEIRRAIIIVVKATCKRYGLSWDWFMPKEDNSIIAAMAANANMTPIPTFGEPVAKS